MIKNIKEGESNAKAATVVSVALPIEIVGAFAGGRSVAELTLEDIAKGRLREFNEPSVICSLFSSDFGVDGDATALVKVLKKSRYKGTLTVLGPPLPKASMVERELRDLAPDLRVKVISL